MSYSDSLNDDECLSISEESENNDVIPYYDSQVKKSEIYLKIPNSNNNNNKKTSSKSLKGIQIRTLESKSYLDIFYRRNNINKLKVKSSKTTMTSTDSECQVYSAYFYSDRNENLSPGLKNSNLALSLSSFNSEFRSCSGRGSSGNSKPANKTPVRKYLSKYQELRKLKPDLQKEKMEMYKKRQQYGQRVSMANKIKLMDEKLLKNSKIEHVE